MKSGNGGLIGVTNKTESGLWKRKDVLLNTNNINEKWAKGTGGTITEADGYRIHIFTSSDTFVCTQPGKIEYLVVAGGGGGGSQIGGGGGAGGLLTSSTILTVNSYAITVGSGGANNANGGNSSLGNIITCIGGGHGGNYPNVAGTNGGSGGGSGASDGVYSTAGGLGIAGQGNRGGMVGPRNAQGNCSGAGGGGAGKPALDRMLSYDAGEFSGGTGIKSDILGTPYWFAGGGGPSTYSAVIGGNGGRGGGGGGSSYSGANGGLGDTNGINSGINGKTGNAIVGGAGGLNTGGGGGSGSYNGGLGGAGGSGVVIIRYRLQSNVNTVLLLHGNEFKDTSSFDVNITNSGVSINSNGKFDKCFDNTGANYITLKSPHLGTGNFTIDFYINPYSWETIYNSVYVVAHTSQPWIGQLSTLGRFGVRLYGVEDILYTTTMPPINIWTHVAIVKEGTIGYIFYDGVLKATNNITTNFAGGINTYLFADGGGSKFKGKIEKFRISKIALWVNNFTPPTEPYKL